MLNPYIPDPKTILIPMRSLGFRRRPLAFFFTVILFLGVGGCGGSKEATVQPLGVTLTGDVNLNDGNAVVVRIYGLGGDANFRRVPPDAFWQDDRAALGSELIGAAREIVLYPQSSEFVTFPLEPTAQFVGVAANLRNPDTDRWRAIIPASMLHEKALRVTVGRSTLTLDVRER